MLCFLAYENSSWIVPRKEYLRNRKPCVEKIRNPELKKCINISSKIRFSWKSFFSEIENQKVDPFYPEFGILDHILKNFRKICRNVRNFWNLEIYDEEICCILSTIVGITAVLRCYVFSRMKYKFLESGNIWWGHTWMVSLHRIIHSNNLFILHKSRV